MYQQFYMLMQHQLAFEIKVVSDGVLWKHQTAFGKVSAKKDCLVVSFSLEAWHEEWKPKKTVQTSKNRIAHYFEVTDNSRFTVLAEGMKQAYQLTYKGPGRLKLTERRKYATVDEYIAAFNEEEQKILKRIREIIRKVAPEAEEKMSWQMPTYHLKENLVHFALQKNHLGFYPSPSGITQFKEELSPYKTTKGAIQFPLKTPIPYDLIEKITLFRVAEVQNKLE